MKFNKKNTRININNLSNSNGFVVLCKFNYIFMFYRISILSSYMINL